MTHAAWADLLGLCLFGALLLAGHACELYRRAIADAYARGRWDGLHGR